MIKKILRLSEKYRKHEKEIELMKIQQIKETYTGIIKLYGTVMSMYEQAYKLPQDNKNGGIVGVTKSETVIPLKKNIEVQKDGKVDIKIDSDKILQALHKKDLTN